MTTVQTVLGPFTKIRYDKFIKAVRLAKKKGKGSFMFEDVRVAMDFAGYLLEYLDPKFKNMK